MRPKRKYIHGVPFKKKPVTDEATNPVAPLSAAAAGEDVVNTPNSSPPVKRRRGRPRKGDNAASMPPPSPTIGPRRSTRRLARSSSPSASSIMSDTSTNKIEGDQTPKQQRGRPRKRGNNTSLPPLSPSVSSNQSPGPSSRSVSPGVGSLASDTTTVVPVLGRPPSPTPSVGSVMSGVGPAVDWQDMGLSAAELPLHSSTATSLSSTISESRGRRANRKNHPARQSLTDNGGKFVSPKKTPAKASRIASPRPSTPVKCSPTRRLRSASSRTVSPAAPVAATVSANPPRVAQKRLDFDRCSSQPPSKKKRRNDGSVVDIENQDPSSFFADEVDVELGNLLHEPLPGPYYDWLLKDVARILQKVAANKGVPPTHNSLYSTTVVGNIPFHMCMLDLQREIELQAAFHELKVCLFNSLHGQSRLAGHREYFKNYTDEDLTLDTVVPNSRIYDKLFDADVIIVEGVHNVTEEEWRQFLRLVSHVKYDDSTLDPEGRVAFILLGDNALHAGVGVAKLTDPESLRTAHRTCYRTSKSPQPTQDIYDVFCTYLAQLSAHHVDSTRPLDHRDRIMNIVTPSCYDFEFFSKVLVHAAKSKFPGVHEVLQLCCHDGKSLRFPDAENIYEFLAHRGQKNTPDWTNPKSFKQVSKVKTRVLSKAQVIFIDGADQLSVAEFEILDYCLRRAKNCGNASCGVCGMKPLFANTLVVFVSSDRPLSREPAFMTTSEAHRAAIYKFNPPETDWFPRPEYVAEPTSNKALDRLTALEMSELRRENDRRFHAVLDLFCPVLFENKRLAGKQNVFIAEGPEFVPLVLLANSLQINPRTRELLTDGKLLDLTCYPTASHRLPYALNLYDMLYNMNVPRDLNYNPSGQPLPELDEDSEWYEALRKAELVIIDGIENLSSFAAETLSHNMNRAKGLDANTDASFGGVLVFMMSGLQVSQLPRGQDRFVGSLRYELALRCDFGTMPPPDAGRTADHAPRGQSPSPDRTSGARIRCVPPVRGDGPAARGCPRGGTIPQPIPEPPVAPPSPTLIDGDPPDSAEGPVVTGLPRGGQQNQPEPTPRANSPDPTGIDGGIGVQTRPRRSCRPPDMTSIYLDQLDDDIDNIVNDDPIRDPDYNPPGGRQGRQNRRINIPPYVKTDRAKQLYRRAVKVGTLNAAKGQLDPKAKAYKSFGFLGSEQCTECKALFFIGEGIKSPTLPGFLQCCQHGKVHFDPPNIPEEIANLLDKSKPQHEEFLKNIRTFNCYFSMASMQAKYARMPHYLPHVVKLHGQIQVLVNSLLPENYVRGSDTNQKCKNVQMMFVDPADAEKSRSSFEPFKHLNPKIVLELHELLKKHNVLYKTFQRMSWYLDKHQKEWKEQNPGARLPNSVLVFKRKAGDVTPIQWRMMGNSVLPVRYEEPTPYGQTEIAAFFDSNERPHNVPLYILQNGKPHPLHPRNFLREPLMYPLMYPDGQPKWYSDTPHRGTLNAVQNKVTIREYYSYIMHMRKAKFLQRMLGTLTQQWVVEGWVRVEDADLDYIKRLDYMRVATRPGLRKFLTDLAEREGMDLGKEYKIPSSFSHSPAQMQANYMNSIQMVRELGLPDLFVTITMDPNSKELADTPGLDLDNPSLNTAEVCRLFWQKIKDFIKIVREGSVFGVCTGIVLVIEWQKRGLPHAHAVLTLAEKCRTAEQVDEFCTTEIPDEKLDPELYKLVTTKMVHQTCGPRCSRNGKCTKGYPMAWREETVMDDGKGFVAMKRPFRAHPDGSGKPDKTFVLGKRTYDRRNIVPYSPYLLKRYGCHVNVVPVNSFRQISYLFKYIFKGGDLAQLQLNYTPKTYKIKNPYRPSTGDLLVAATRVSHPRTPATGQPVAPVAAGTGSPPDPPQAAPAPPASTPVPDPGLNFSNGQSRVQEADPAANEKAKPVLHYDEATFYQACRYVSSMEATWRLLGLPLFYFSHKVHTLHVHLKGDNPLVFKKGEAAEIAEKAVRPSMLTAYFDLVRDSRLKPDDDPERLLLTTMLYSDVVKHYVWNKTDRKWTRRVKSNKPNLGRLAAAAPNCGDRFYLRLLLQEVPGCADFEELRTHNGTIFATNKEACVSRGLARDDKEYKRCLEEAALHSSPYRLRLLFVVLLSHCQIISPSDLFDLHWKQMAHYWLKPIGKYTADEARLICKQWIRRRVRANYGNVEDPLFNGVPETEKDPPEGDEPPPHPNAAAARARFDALNDDQKIAANAVISAVKVWCANREKTKGQYVCPSGKSVFFIEGAAGTGKTTTYKAIYDTVEAMGETVVCMAFTGSAACLLPKGRTCHNTLKLPVPLHEDSVSSLEYGHEQWKLLEKAALIVVDEVAMAPSVIMSILDSVLRRIYDATAENYPIFAGKVVLFGGDLRQLGPIPNDGQTMSQLHFRNSPAFACAELKSLNINMRTIPDELEFANFLREVGEGRTPPTFGFPLDSVIFKPDMVIEDYKLETLIAWTFGADPSISGASSAILTPFNSDCFTINKMIVDALPGESFIALSEDSVLDDTSRNRLLARPRAAQAAPVVDAATSAQPANPPDAEEIEDIDPETHHEHAVDAEVAEVDSNTNRRLVHQDELHMTLETGMPPHRLELKPGAIIHLIKNLDVESGLVNGCRLRVKAISRDRLDAEIISDFPNLKERDVTLPRVRFLKECGHAFTMQRIQFPVRLGFACTINKSQGLTLDKVGIYLPKYLNDHGKLYVAMSRVRRRRDLKLLIIDDIHTKLAKLQGKHPDCNMWYTRNFVIQQLWDVTQPARPPLPLAQRRPPPQAHLEASDFTPPERMEDDPVVPKRPNAAPSTGNTTNTDEVEKEVREAVQAFLEDEFEASDLERLKQLENEVRDLTNEEIKEADALIAAYAVESDQESEVYSEEWDSDVEV